MFDNLVVSNPRKKKVGERLPSALLSLVLHTGLIYWAITATMIGDTGEGDAPADTTLVFLQEEQEEEPEPEPEQPIARLNPPPMGFQIMTAPIVIPTEIPPIDLNQRFDPRDFSGVGIEGGIFEGVVGGTGPVDLNQMFVEAMVDERPENISCPPLNYPELLRQAGIEGTVLIQAVIDTTGHVEPGSIQILSSDHAQFERPARSLLQRCIYRPGRIRGRPVRVLVQQPITFTITRR